jgi:plastocyanin
LVAGALLGLSGGFLAPMPATAYADVVAGAARAAVVAGPAAPITGYVTRTVVVVAGDGVDFLNADSVFHDVVSTDVDGSGRPLFRSASSGDMIATVRRMPVVGVESLPPGVYSFRCTPHASMTGSLVVQGAGPS